MKQKQHKEKAARHTSGKTEHKRAKKGWKEETERKKEQRRKKKEGDQQKGGKKEGRRWIQIPRGRRRKVYQQWVWCVFQGSDLLNLKSV